MSIDRPIPYAVAQRLRLIDVMLAHFGQCKRGALMDYFGISQPQASLDLKEYITIAPENAAYDHAARAHVRLDTYRQLWP